MRRSARSRTSAGRPASSLRRTGPSGPGVRARPRWIITAGIIRAEGCMSPREPGPFILLSPSVRARYPVPVACRDARRRRAAAGGGPGRRYPAEEGPHSGGHGGGWEPAGRESEQRSSNDTVRGHGEGAALEDPPGPGETAVSPGASPDRRDEPAPRPSRRARSRMLPEPEWGLLPPPGPAVGKPAAGLTRPRRPVAYLGPGGSERNPVPAPRAGPRDRIHRPVAAISTSTRTTPAAWVRSSRSP